MRLVPVLLVKGSTHKVIGVAEVYRNGSVKSCRLDDPEFIKAFLSQEAFSLGERRTDAKTS